MVIYKLEKYKKGVLIDEEFSFFKQLLLFYVGTGLKKVKFFSRKHVMYVIKKYELKNNVEEIALNNCEKMNGLNKDLVEKEFYV